MVTPPAGQAVFGLPCAHPLLSGRFTMEAAQVTTIEEVTSSLSRVEETCLGYDRHFISDEAFDELLNFLNEDSGYVHAC
jgi:hypothetical protein